jgi:hypothetical protein
MRNRGNIFWGVILIVLAALLLLSQNGLISGSIFNYFWPLAIIALGVWLIIGFFTRNRTVEGKNFSMPLEGAASAYVKLNHAAGRLNMHSGAETGELFHGTFGGGLYTNSHRENDRLDVKIRTPQQFWAWWPGESLDWDISLNRDVPISLKIDSGASASVLDLSDLKVTDLDIDTGASSTELTLPANAGNTHVDIDTGASSLKVTVPAGVAASIRVKSGIASVNVNSRFARIDGNLYRSDDYNTASNRVDMTIDAGVGSIEVR